MSRSLFYTTIFPHFLVVVEWNEKLFHDKNMLTKLETHFFHMKLYTVDVNQSIVSVIKQILTNI